MVIGLISDSHDHLPHVKQAVLMFKQHNVDLVLHAGDYCSPFIIEPFEGLALYGVFGKHDGDHSLLKEKFDAIDGKVSRHFAEFELGGLDVALYNGIEAPITSALEKCGSYDVVVSGHTHERKADQIEDTLSINPGTVHGFGEEATIGLFNTEAMRVDFLTLYS